MILAVLAGGAYYAVSTGVDKIKDQFELGRGLPGPGSGEVIFEVKSGDTIAVMGAG